jgi:3-deoxy-D-manno-octulosonic acid kinase
LKLPAGLEPVDGPKGWGFAAPEARDWLRGVLSRGEMLRTLAAAHEDSIELRGRGPVHALSAPTGRGRWVVRPYRRGGAVAAPLLRDRHLRVGVPRPVAEARASGEVSLRGIPTPRVLAGALYPRGLFYRADIVTEYIPASRDLAEALFGGEATDRSPLLEEAGLLVARLARAGVEHADLNARNILLSGAGEALMALLLDLDRCRVRARTPLPPHHMLARLERSLRKIGERRGSSLEPAEWDVLRRSVLGA